MVRYETRGGGIYVGRLASDPLTLAPRDHHRRIVTRGNRARISVGYAPAGVQDLAAAGQAQATATAEMLKGVSLAADALAQASASATLNGAVDLAADAAGVAVASADMAHDVPLAAAGSAQASGTADIGVSSSASLTPGQRRLRSNRTPRLTRPNRTQRTATP